HVEGHSHVVLSVRLCLSGGLSGRHTQLSGWAPDDRGDFTTMSTRYPSGRLVATGNCPILARLPPHIGRISEWPLDYVPRLLPGCGTWRAVWRESRRGGVRLFWEMSRAYWRSPHWRIRRPRAAIPPVACWSDPRDWRTWMI